MPNRLRTLAVATGLATLVFAAPARAADVSGKTIALAHVNNFNDTYTIDATIAKGKKHHALVIHSEANILVAQALDYCLGPTLTVNGLALAQPGPGLGAACTSCNPGGSCSIHGTYFFDLDAAESLFPGTVYNQPLVVHHSGSPANVGGVTLGNAVLTVTMHKK